MLPTPREKGVKSNTFNSLLFLTSLWAFQVAPVATASSTLNLLLILLGPNLFIIISLIFGILEEPPTKIISSISSFENLESVKILSRACSIFLKISLHIILKSSLCKSIYKSMF